MKSARITLFTGTLMAATMWGGAAQAITLPWLTDPWGLEEKTAATYGTPNLKPMNCPGRPAPGHSFTMSEVVIISLCHNPDNKAAYLNLLANAATYGSNYAAYLPTISATTGYDNEKIFHPSRSSTLFRGSDTGMQAGITAGMTVFDFGKREATIDAAEQTLAAAGQSYNSTLQGAIATALQGYYKLLTSQNAVEAALESERFASASYEAAQLRRQIGQVALADELQAKGSYSQALLATQQTKNQLLQDQAELALLMGLPPDRNLTVEEMDDSFLKLAPFGGKVQELIKQAKEKRLDLAAQKSQLASSEAALSALKRSDLPNISVSAGQNFNNLKLFNNDTSRLQTFGVSVSIPIFSGFAQTYNERSAKEKLSAQREQVAKTELSVQQDVWNSWNNYQTAKQSWDTSLDLLESATQLRDVALGRYKEGLGTILDVLNAQSQYSAALQSHLKARYDLLTTRTDLVRAAGVLDLKSMQPNTTMGGTLEPPIPADKTAPKDIKPAEDKLPEVPAKPEIPVKKPKKKPVADIKPAADAPSAPATP